MRNLKYWVVAAAIVAALLFSLHLSTARADVALVGTQKTGATAAASSVTKAFAGNVTAGDLIVIGASGFAGGNNALVVSKSAGTATISAVSTALSSTTVNFSQTVTNGIYYATVTGTGSLTMQAAKTGASNSFITIAEFSGASGVVSKTASSTAINATETSSAITSTAGGAVVMFSNEASSGTFTYTQSATNIFNDSNGANFTGQGQYLLTPSSGAQTLTAAIGNTWEWLSVSAVFDATASAAPTTDTSAGFILLNE